MFVRPHHRTGHTVHKYRRYMHGHYCTVPTHHRAGHHVKGHHRRM